MAIKRIKGQETLHNIIVEVSKVIVGKDELKELLLVALLSQGHVLIEGTPGTAKTTTARTFARVIGGNFKRVQGTPDMLPSDILGFYLYRSDGTSTLIPGPVFANILLADELNRTTPRTQSALLEVMQENKLNPQDISKILVETTTRGADILSDPSKYKPTTKETADHSLPYCIAVAVAKGNVLPSDFQEEALRDKLVWSLLEKIKVIANPEIDHLFPKKKRAIVSIMTSKKTYKKQEDYAKGQPERALTDQEIISKFKANAETEISSERMDKL